MGPPECNQDDSPNDQAFEVRWSLYCALYYLRETKPHDLLWIDAICVDQSNVSE
jgi:hypothetical protein